MSAFKEVLDVGSLSDHEIGHIEFVLASPAYLDHFAPYLTRMRDSLNSALLDPSQARKDQLPDDFVRGGIVMIDGLLTLFRKLIDETRIERMARVQTERTPEQTYQHMRETGKAQHSGQTAQPAEPTPAGYNADEDF